MFPSSFGETLSRLWPNGDCKISGLRAGIIATAPKVFEQFGITSPLLIAHVMAQISHEFGAGREVVESLSYTASRMMQVWPSRFPTFVVRLLPAIRVRSLTRSTTAGWAMPSAPTRFCLSRPRSVADHGQGRLSAPRQGDRAQRRHPDLVNDPRYFLLYGVADFINCGCLKFAQNDDVVGVTRRLNGGFVGFAERKVWLAKWKAAFADAPVVAPATLPAPTAPPRAAPATTQPVSAFEKLFVALSAAFSRT